MGRLDKQIDDTLAQIQRTTGALWVGIVRGPEANSPDDALGAFGALEETLGDAEALEAKLYELKSVRSGLTIQQRRLIRELRDARLEMQKVPKVPFKELMRVVKSQKSTEEEYEAAKTEMRRREMLRLAIGQMLEGTYPMPNKSGAYSGYVHASSTAREVRNRPIKELAWLFKEEHAKMTTAALCELLGRPDSDGSDVSVTELCGLSEEHGLLFVGEREYWDLLVKNKAKVDAIIGTALKAKLRSMDPEHWECWADSEDSADGAIAKRQRA